MALSCLPFAAKIKELREMKPLPAETGIIYTGTKKTAIRAVF